MPIPVDRAATARMAARFHEAAELVGNEFTGLDTDRQYRNAFARLLKPDPLGRVLMMGTDQRDLFVPLLRAAIAASVPAGGHLFDFGAGDGQTFALLADAVPAGTTVSFEEPNPHYVADYRALLARLPHLRAGAAVTAGFEDLDGVAARDALALPADGTVHLALALHMIFFLTALPAALVRMARFLAPGGVLCIVVADETDGYTGLALKAFIAGGGDTGDNARHLAAIAERQRLLGPAHEGGGAILEDLREALPRHGFTLETVRQPSRLYGHTLADLVALANISILSRVAGLEKFAVPLALLRDAPESVGLRIEDSGPRSGMLSVTQPQFVAMLRRHS